MEQELKDQNTKDVGHGVPELMPGVKHANDQMPQLSKMQIDLMINAFAADFARVATLQYTNSVGQARMRWIGVDESHHELSHHPDSNKTSQEHLTKINKWYAEQLAYLAKRLAETPEPGGGGSLLDNTTIVWTNEAGQGELAHARRHPVACWSATGLGFRMGRSRSSSRRWRTTGCCWPWPTAWGNHILRSSATRTSAATGCSPCDLVIGHWWGYRPSCLRRPSSIAPSSGHPARMSATANQ